MMIVGRWRWPLTVGLPLILGAVLVLSGATRLHYVGRTVLEFSGAAPDMESELKIFQSDLFQKRVDVALASKAVKITYDPAPGHQMNIVISGEGTWPKQVVKALGVVSQVSLDQSLFRRKTGLHKEVEALQPLKTEAQLRYNTAAQQRDVYLAAHPMRPPRGDASAKIKELQTRRQFLIDHYPTHTDIPLLAKKIQALQSHGGGRSGVVPERLNDLDRVVNESKLRLDITARAADEVIKKEKDLKSAWKVLEPAQNPKWPLAIDRFPLLLGVMLGAFALACAFLRSEFKPRKGSAADGLWKPGDPQKTAEPEKVEEPAKAAEPAKPVELTVVSAEPSETPVQEVVVKESALPSDPLTQKAAELYSKWVEVSKVLYAPAVEAPQGVIESVGPLLQETIEFLPEGHDVLARYLARTVAPGDLPAHVARTVLMTLTGAQDAGVSEQHRMAMALAALFHDLAVVPRPAAVQDEVGSDVGRLSASVLRRIPGIEPMMLAMVEDILIGMDEFKLETWQNVANGKSLEPLSKVLREIDRFEKVMQKQKSRLDRQVTERKAG